ncbi:initiation control protein YabA, partial [Staphylococcus epidermidis]|uniref:initiation control protein YabA n=1 Tax=Staphylococcus epidermidis TaxID=1282 RepID=UPI0011A3E141
HVQQLTTDISELKHLTLQLLHHNLPFQLQNENLKPFINKTQQSLQTHLHKHNYNHLKTPSPTKHNLPILYPQPFHISNGQLFPKHRHAQ